MYEGKRQSRFCCADCIGNSGADSFWRGGAERGDPGRDDYYGWDRVDARAALDMVLAKRADLNTDWVVDENDLAILTVAMDTNDLSADNGAHGPSLVGARIIVTSLLEDPPPLWENRPIRNRKRWRVGMCDVTRILNAIERGDAKATDELLPLVYEELRLLAAQKLSHEPPGQTLQATALVHEVYLRLVGDEPQSWENRGHFFAAAAEAMRRILVENARRKKSTKHGGGHSCIDFDAVEAAAQTPSDDLVALDEALSRLGDEDPVKATLVKLRFFAGLSIDQAAEALGMSRATAIRHWSFARAWLFHQLHKGG